MKAITLLSAATLLVVPALARAQTGGGAQVKSNASVDASAGSRTAVSADAQTQVNADLRAARASHEALVRAGREHPSEEETTRGARLIARGYTGAQIESVARRAPSDRSLAVAFETMASLQTRGVSTARATAQIEQQLAAHASDEQLRDIALDANAAAGASGALGTGRAAGSATTGAGATGSAAAGVGALGGGVSGTIGGVLRARP